MHESLKFDNHILEEQISIQKIDCFKMGNRI